jgi:hypothetical protein
MVTMKQIHLMLSNSIIDDNKLVYGSEVLMKSLENYQFLVFRMCEECSHVDNIKFCHQSLPASVHKWQHVEKQMKSSQNFRST